MSRPEPHDYRPHGMFDDGICECGLSRESALHRDIPPPVARRTDPETSHEAAATVTEQRARIIAVVKMLRDYGPLTHVELVSIYTTQIPIDRLPPQAASGIRTRCHEAVELGLVRWTGEYRVLDGSTRRHRVWEVTP